VSRNVAESRNQGENCQFETHTFGIDVDKNGNKDNVTLLLLKK